MPDTQKSVLQCKIGFEELIQIKAGHFIRDYAQQLSISSHENVKLSQLVRNNVNHPFNPFNFTSLAECQLFFHKWAKLEKDVRSHNAEHCKALHSNQYRTSLEVSKYKALQGNFFVHFKLCPSSVLKSELATRIWCQVKTTCSIFRRQKSCETLGKSVGLEALMWQLPKSAL